MYFPKLTFEEFMAIWIPYGMYFGFLIYNIIWIIMTEVRK